MHLEETVEISWADFKAFLVRTAIPYYWVQLTNGSYQIRAQQGCLIVATMILITNPANADQLEFEASYKV